ncbi:MAG TPA: hypothetical protein VII01_11115 [Solirubrobacteraceae bacterium]
MSKAFEDLEKQLRSAVRAGRDPSRTTWARHGRRQTWMLVAAALLVISAGAFGASRIAAGKNAEAEGRDIALQAVIGTDHVAACRLLEPVSRGVTFTENPVLPAITRLLPLLGKPPSASGRARALALLARFGPTGGAVLGQTLHVVRLQEGIGVVVLVSQGVGFGAVHNPTACARARQARATELTAGDAPAVRRSAQLSLSHRADTARGVQSLEIFAHDPRARGIGGGARPTLPGERLEPGLRQVNGRRDGSRLFLGIAAGDATAVRIQTKQIAAMHGLPIQVPVRARFYAVKVPRGLRPFRLLEVGAGGSVLRSINLRQ